MKFKKDLAERAKSEYKPLLPVTCISRTAEATNSSVSEFLAPFNTDCGSVDHQLGWKLL